MNSMSADASAGIKLYIDNAAEFDDVPGREAFHDWVEAALAGRMPNAHISIRIVSAAESRRYNARYRQRDSATNVLSFAADINEYPESLPILGDLMICAEIVADEAAAQGKLAADHWAHMVVHGTLHLLGYEHQSDAEARVMEQRERTALRRLGIADPYLV